MITLSGTFVVSKTRCSLIVSKTRDRTKRANLEASVRSRDTGIASYSGRDLIEA